MKRPDTVTLVVGHPIIAWPLMAACLFALYVAWETGNPIMAMVGLGLLAKLGTASESVRDYRAFQREWAAMDPDAPRQRAFRRARISMTVWGLALVVAIVVYPEKVRDGAGIAGVGFGALLVLGFLMAGVRWVRRRRPAKQRTPVVTIVAKPLLPVPTMANAYRALPAHCAAILRVQA